MKSINEFKNKTLEPSDLYKIHGGRYKKSGCGSKDMGGGMVMEYKCDVYDDEGKKPTYYYGSFIHPK